MRAIYPMALVVNGTKQILTGLVVAGAVMFLPHGALAAANGTSVLHFTFKTAMTNTVVNPAARGTIYGNLNRRGNANNLRLRITLAKLDRNTAYQLVAYIDNDTNATSVATITTDSKGAFKVTYVKKGWSDASPGGTPLPDVLSPICTIRELAIVNGGGQTVLQSDLTDPDQLHYGVNNFMANTGFIPVTVGSVKINASKTRTQFWLRALGLTPTTDYVLTINGNVAQTNTTDSAGQLKLTALPAGSTDILNIHTLALTDISGSNVVLTTDGLGVPCDTTAPTVISTIPANAAVSVPINSQLAATFSKAMNPATITNTTFTLKHGSTTVTGTVSYAGVTAVFAPTTALSTGVLYTATITTGVTDLAGNALASDFVWSFMTGASTDTVRPTVIATIPTNTATSVAINSKLTATFSKAMNPVTITNTTFTLKQGTTTVTGTVSYVGITATFAPTANLAISSPFTATITTGATDLSGNALATNYVWSFTTSASTDLTVPTVISTVPTNNATGVAINHTISATFSKAMDPATIIAANFTVTGPGSTMVTGTVAYVALGTNFTATFTPVTNLAASTLYTNTITAGVKDLAGNLLALTNWSFMTGTLIDTNLMSIPLGRASTFAIMATAAISGGADNITGDVGLSPGSSQGIPPSEINGTIHVNDQAIIDAQADLLAAYNTAVARSVGKVTVSGDLGGTTKTPGLYWSSSSIGITGDLTLDAQGDANAVFVFQMGSTLTTGPGAHIVLIGGAQAKNIYWQVGSSATLDTTTIFKGNILAAVTITVNNGAAVEGRLFAGSGGGGGSVTVQSSTITVPAP